MLANWKLVRVHFPDTLGDCFTYNENDKIKIHIFTFEMPENTLKCGYWFISRYWYWFWWWWCWFCCRDSPTVWPLCAFFFILLQFYVPFYVKKKKIENFMCLLEFECAKRLKAHSRAIPAVVLIAWHHGIDKSCVLLALLLYQESDI